MGDMQSGKQVTIKLPSNARELTVEQYQKFLKVEGDDTFKMLKALEIFANIPLKVAYAMKAEDIMEISSRILAMLTKKYPLVSRFKYQGVEMGFVPNLEEISFAEYVDLDACISDLQLLHKTVGILYRPVVKGTKNVYEIGEYIPNDGFKQFPLDVALGAVLFFYRLSNKLQNRFPTYSEKVKQVKESTQPLTSSLSDGDGTEA